MNPFWELLVAVPLLLGTLFGVLGSVGLWRLPDFYMRLHTPTKTTTLGVGSVLLASCLYFGLIHGQLSWHEGLISLFLFITAPISAHMLAKTALFLHQPSRSEIPAKLQAADDESRSSS